MAVETTRSLASLLEETLKPDDPWLPPRPWESIPTESGASLSSSNATSATSPPLYDNPAVSESSLIRIAINGLQGMESALSTIEKLSTTFYSYTADGTFRRNPSIWKRTSSTLALGRILKSIGCSGCVVFLLRKFVDHFENLHLDGSLSCHNLPGIETDDNQNDSAAKLENHTPQSLVNHAFSVAVRKLLEGCIAAVDTLYASVNLRHSLESVDMSSCSFGVGSLTRSEHFEVTLLEVYLHSKELRTQIDLVGNICQIRDIAFCFGRSSLQDLISKANSAFLNIPRGGDLLTYLYSHLRVVDPVHSALLKFLFIRSCEPYCEFIRSWIYKAEISDPYKEFMVEYAEILPSYSSAEAGSSHCIWLKAVKERVGVVVPCFLKDICIPIFRAGQQLQVLMKLLELSGHSSTDNFTYGDILPCWSDFSSDCSSDTSPFSFDRISIEAMALARNNYYRGMMGKIGIILEKLGPRFQQVVSHGTGPAFLSNCGESQKFLLSLRNDDGCISPTTDNKDVELIVDSSNSEASSTTDEFPCVEDQLDSSDCLSLDDSEEHNESVQFIQLPDGNGQKYLSALELLSSGSNENSLRLTCNSNMRKPGEGDSFKLHEITSPIDLFTHSCLTETNMSGNLSYHESVKPNWSWFSEAQCGYNLHDTGSLFTGLVKNPFSIDEMVRCDATSLHFESGFVSARKRGVLGKFSPYLSNKIVNELSLTNETNDNDQFPRRTCCSSSSFSLPSLNTKWDSNPLSMNPILFKSGLLRKREKSLGIEQINHPPCFDFSSVNDPFKMHENILPERRRHYFGSETTSHKNPNASAPIGSTKFFNKDCYDGHETFEEKNEFPHVNFTLSSENSKKEVNMEANICGGSSWESMLSCSGKTVENSARVRRKGLAETFDIPLDFVIEKCLLQEIFHQYWYVSKLTIKLLEEGFSLRKHFLALRRYHFMELADWADLFIVSLWNQKWDAMDANRMVSEIQGLLAMSLQKSSCERDDYKDRLFVYMKRIENNMTPSLIPKIGIDSFNFLGLGYKVDWPISIVVTDGALKIYAKIFSFLLRLKLAVFSLTDIWCLMKDLLNFNSQSRYSKAFKQQEIQEPQSEMQHLNTLTTVRHQVNHFVTTLQQYVQSQLSHVSWCRFTDSLKNKVKDMMDLDSVHMAYLVDSLHICFLSDEMKVVASIIKNILQCALDLRSCLIGTKGGGQLEGFPDKLSRVDISQVLAVKRVFENNLVDLHMCYLTAPKHREFGIAQFWGFLNYNEYYSDLVNKRNYYGFSV